MFTINEETSEVYDHNGNVILTIEQRNGRNRCVIAQQSFKRGDVVVQETPYSMIITSAFTPVACNWCAYTPDSVKGEKLYGVAANDPVRYCSHECLQADNALHALEVKALEALKALSIEGNTEALRLIIRMAAMRKQEILNLKLTVGIPKHPLCGRSNTFSHMLSLEAPTGSIDADSLQDILNVAQVLESLLEDAAIPLNSEDINHMLLATQSNAHRITDTEKKCVGLGAFPFISMLNHSCCPNCSHHFVVEKGSPPILVMQAIDDIDVGDELCYNYVPLYQSTERRRGLLNSAYSFTCDCRRCLQASSESHAESVFSPSIFPCDSILSALDFAVNKKLSSLNCEENKVTLDFINAVPCDEESFHKVTAEISMCNNLMASAASNSKACKSIIKKLVKMFGDELKAGTIHPCHELVLNAYVTCARGCCSLLTQEKVLNTDEKLDIAKICVGMGGLALGCIIKYTRVRNDDIADLERMIGIAMQSLTNTEVSCNAQDFSSLFVRAAHEALVAMNYFWASEPVVSDLLAVATTYASVVCSDDDPMSLSQAFLKSSDISNLKR